MRENMDFLLQTNIGSYYANLGLFAFLFVVCVVFVFLIGKTDFVTSLYDKNVFLGIFLLGTLFFGFWSYQAFVDIKKL